MWREEGREGCFCEHVKVRLDLDEIVLLVFHTCEKEFVLFLVLFLCVIFFVAIGGIEVVVCCDPQRGHICSD